MHTIATSVVTLTSIVLTVTLVTVQLAMGQFSPRIVRALLEDRSDQVAIAIFARSTGCMTVCADAALVADAQGIGSGADIAT